MTDPREPKRCGEPSAIAYYWPKMPMQYACAEHGALIKENAKILNIHVEIREDTTHACQQVLEET